MSMYDANGAASYAANRRVHPGVLRSLLENGGLGQERTALEVGCGTGNYITALQEQTGCQAWGVDPSPDMLARALERQSAVIFSHGRAEELPFKDDRFDLVYSVDVIHHVKDRPAGYREAARVLRAGGLVCTVTDSEEIIRGRAPMARYFPEIVPVELARYPSMAELRAAMEAAGFGDYREEVVEVRGEVGDIQAFRDKAFSSLHLISQDAFERGLARMEDDLARGPLEYIGRYVLVWGRKA